MGHWLEIAGVVITIVGLAVIGLCIGAGYAWMRRRMHG